MFFFSSSKPWLMSIKEMKPLAGGGWEVWEQSFGNFVC